MRSSVRQTTPRLNSPWAPWALGAFSALGTTSPGGAIERLEPQMFDGGTEWNLSQIPLEPYGYLSNFGAIVLDWPVLEPNANYYVGSDKIFEFGKIAFRHSGFEPHTSRHFNHWAISSAHELINLIIYRNDLINN